MGASLKIELVVSDDCLEPEFHKPDEKVSVRIGLNHDFDDILDICAGALTNEQLALIHKLWSDDDFPRSFKRVGGNLIITERDVQ